MIYIVGDGMKSSNNEAKEVLKIIKETNPYLPNPIKAEIRNNTVEAFIIHITKNALENEGMKQQAVAFMNRVKEDPDTVSDYVYSIMESDLWADLDKELIENVKCIVEKG